MAAGEGTALSGGPLATAFAAGPAAARAGLAPAAAVARRTDIGTIGVTVSRDFITSLSSTLLRSSGSGLTTAVVKAIKIRSGVFAVNRALQLVSQSPVVQLTER